MCGICGYVGIEDDALILQMMDSLSHRGPDDSGHFLEGDVGLGHRRLSIIDLASGHQPMASDDGSLVIVFNGEIYNFGELRAGLEKQGIHFRTRSDTEVLLRLYETLREPVLDQLNGMFAFAIYDRNRGELFLARDRVGIKPLYYIELPGKLLFASEMKALLRYGGWARTLNMRAVHEYLALRYVPGGRGMFREVKRLPPGHFLRYHQDRTTVRRYWAPPSGGGRSPKPSREYLDECAEILETSVRRRLISDVPFGAYLSGGLDSSVIVALMSRIVSSPVKTFSVGFDYKHDELSEAAQTARLLGCDHQVVECRPQDVSLLPNVVYHSDEPPGDAISIPMYLLAQEAKKKVSVILTGEGADEIFGGYLFHKVMWAGSLYDRFLPNGAHRSLILPLLSMLPAWTMNLAFRYPAYLGERGKRKVLDYVELLGSGTLPAQYRHLISLFDSRETEHLYSSEFKSELSLQQSELPDHAPTRGAVLDQILGLQFHDWLPDNMLLRQDKMGMASAIEGRVPYLDHEVVEFAFRLPANLRLGPLAGKYILRRFAERLLPRSTARRRKMPFYVPVENYFEQPFFVEMMEDLLSESSVRRRGLFRPQAVERLRASMHRREFLRVKQVFSLLTLELWFRIFVDQNGLI